MNRRRSEDSSGSISGSGRKEQQSPLEMDGEWYGDALDTAVSVPEKVRCYSMLIVLSAACFVFLCSVYCC